MKPDFESKEAEDLWEEFKDILTEGEKKVRGQLCVLTGVGSGGGFIKCSGGVAGAGEAFKNEIEKSPIVEATTWGGGKKVSVKIKNQDGVSGLFKPALNDVHVREGKQDVATAKLMAKLGWGENYPSIYEGKLEADVEVPGEKKSFKGQEGPYKK